MLTRSHTPHIACSVNNLLSVQSLSPLPGCVAGPAASPAAAAAAPPTLANLTFRIFLHFIPVSVFAPEESGVHMHNASNVRQIYTSQRHQCWCWHSRRGLLIRQQNSCRTGEKGTTLDYEHNKLIQQTANELTAWGFTH